MTTTVLRIPYRITDLRRDDKGHWIAKVNGQAVFRTWGSWQTFVSPADLHRMADVLPYIAADLQAQVRVLERAERKRGRIASSAMDVHADSEDGGGPLAPSGAN